MTRKSSVNFGLAALSAWLVACAGALRGVDTPAPPAADRRLELAPIEEADLQLRESYPVQYAVRVVSGLPSGCARFGRIDVARQDALIQLTVWNTMPADQGVACTMIYGYSEHVIELGSDFDTGRRYEVLINGTPSLTFTHR
jgi:hypothetical protein